VTIAGEGTYSVQSDGTVRFTPEPGFVGQSGTIAYRMTDSFGQVSHSTVHVTVQAPPLPTAASETKRVAQSGTVSFTPVLGANGLTAAANGAPALVSSSLCIIEPSTNVCGPGPVVLPGVGTYTLDPASGRVTFVASGDAVPGAGSGVTYRITDALGRQVSGVLTPEVFVGPVGRDNTSVGAVGTVQLIPVANNDTTATDGASLVPRSVRLCGAAETAPRCTRTTLKVPGQGTYAVDARGMVTFTPAEGFTGTASGVTYMIKDSGGRVATARVVPTVSGQVPVASPDFKSGRSGSRIVVDPLGNDRASATGVGAASDVSLDRLSVRLCATGEQVPACSALTVVTPEGTYTVNPTTGRIVFVHAPGFSGVASMGVVYQVRNSSGSASDVASSVFVPTVEPQLPVTGSSTVHALWIAGMLLSAGLLLRFVTPRAI
jgi:CshA-type fibril repeat protein